MLQQTQTDRVVPKYLAWVKAFPHFSALAAAPVAAVLKEWLGLGYNRRALALKKCAEIVVKEYEGKLPKQHELLEQLPGVGPYTAGAIRAFAFGKPEVFVETNIRRVFLHHFFPRRRNVSDAELYALIEHAMPTRRIREWYWALMDYGAALPKILRPRGVANPNRRSRHYTLQSTFEGSRRQVRGAVLKMLAEAKVVSKSAIILILKKRFSSRAGEIPEIISDLAKERFISVRGRMICLPE